MQEDPNIDSQELEKFARLSEEWWDPDGKLKTLHHINPTRLSYVEQLLELAGKKVLDIGCGGGILSEAMADAGAVVTGIDANKSAVDIALLHRSNTEPVITYETSTAEDYAEKHGDEFDAITCMELLEHVPDISSLLNACAKLLKPDGHLILSTVNRTLKSYATAIIAAEYVLKLLPKGTHDYDKFIKPSELASCLRQLNFELIDVTGMSYIPGINKSSLVQNPSINYLAYARLKT
jgi:2-polyprenyl-6-hydroxyphenyl methylase/3-demethylubiquinone-9 3-methyltransferase